MMRLKSLVTSGLLLALVLAAADSGAAPKKPKKDPKPVPAPTAEADFDRQAAVTALAAVDLAKCKSTNAARGDGHVMVTFDPGGTAAGAVVDKGPMAGTPAGKCIAKEFKKTKVPAFKGDVVQVGKVFRFD